MEHLQTEEHTSVTSTNGESSGLSASTSQGSGPPARPDVRPKERFVRHTDRRSASQPPVRQDQSSSTPSQESSSSRRRLERALREYKALLDSVELDQAFLSSAPVQAVHINLRDDALPHERQLILSAARACLVRTTRYPKAPEILACILDADFEEENILRQFVTLCENYGGVDNVPFFQLRKTNRGQDQGSRGKTASGSGGQISASGKVSGDVRSSGEVPGPAQGSSVGATLRPPHSQASTEHRHGGQQQSRLVEVGKDSNGGSFEASNVSTQDRSDEKDSRNDNNVCPARDQGSFHVESEYSTPLLSSTSEDVENNESKDRAQKSDESHSKEKDREDSDEEKGRGERTGGKEEGASSSTEDATGHKTSFSWPQTQVEWAEKLARVVQRERQYLKNRTTCTVCERQPVEVTFLPCSHLVTCSECASDCKKCPLCDQKIVAEAKTFVM